MADGVVAGWFEGLTTDELTAAVRARLANGGGFVVQWWGVSHICSGDHRAVMALELGDRAQKDVRLENAAHHGDRRDWVVSKAVAACPASNGEFLTLGPAGC
jgi:hypothetical protein